MDFTAVIVFVLDFVFSSEIFFNAVADSVSANGLCQDVYRCLLAILKDVVSRYQKWKFDFVAFWEMYYAIRSCASLFQRKTDIVPSRFLLLDYWAPWNRPWNLKLSSKTSSTLYKHLFLKLMAAITWLPDFVNNLCKCCFINFKKVAFKSNHHRPFPLAFHREYIIVFHFPLRFHQASFLPPFRMNFKPPQKVLHGNIGFLISDTLVGEIKLALMRMGKPLMNREKRRF